MKKLPYTLTLTEEEVSTIAFVGGRYSWSLALLALDVGDNALHEYEAWQIRDAFEADTEGGHAMFPMLDHRSTLCEKLSKFADSVV